MSFDSSCLMSNFPISNVVKYGDGHTERLPTLNRGKALLKFWREMQAKGAADRVCLSHVFKGQLLPEQNVIFVLLNRKSAKGLFSRM